MPLTVSIDKDKTLQSLVYICANSPRTDLIHILKILYFAEQYHLQNFGRLICGNTYARMQYGPVPSEAYDILKAIDDRPDNYFATTNPILIEKARMMIRVEKPNQYPCFYPTTKPDETIFSKSDIKSFDWAIREVGNLSFEQLKEKSHDQLWKIASEAKLHWIPLETMVSILPNKDALLEFLSDRG